jgi:hypothetical protein
VLTHGFVKQGAAVPPEEIEMAKRYRARFMADPTAHTRRED